MYNNILFKSEKLVKNMPHTMFVAVDGLSISSAEKLNNAFYFDVGEIRVSPVGDNFSPVNLRKGIPLGDKTYDTLYFLQAQVGQSTDERAIEFPKQYVNDIKALVGRAVRAIAPDRTFKIGFLEELV